jgi:hypothetical protein
MVGVAKGLGTDIPGLFPAQTLDIQEQTHQFGDGDGGMGVVQLDGHRFVEIIETFVVLAEPPEDILKGRGHKKILLLQTQLLTSEIVIRRIEDLGDSLGTHLRFDGADIIPRAEIAEIELPRGPGGPEPHVDHMIIFIAGDEDITGDGHHILGVDPFRPVTSFGVLVTADPAVKMDRKHWHSPFEFPRGPIAQPIIRGLNLIAIDQLLEKQSVFIADTVPVCRNLQSGD